MCEVCGVQDGAEPKKKKKKNKKKGGSGAAVVVDEAGVGAVHPNGIANETQEVGVGAVDEDEEDGEPGGDGEGKVAGKKFICCRNFCDRG